MGRQLDHVARPVLNRPHEEPSRHWQLAEDNTSTGVAVDGRRISQALVVVPKARGLQLRMQVTAAEQNELVNRIRDEVAGWRGAGYPGATAASRQMLWHWRSEANEPRLFFAQVEAAETLIWLAEADARRYPALARVRRDMAEANDDYNAGVGRLAVRMATGSGKTAVMGMVVAWHAVNAAVSQRRDGRYTTCFLAITPGHTVRERLGVLHPAHPENVYEEMRLLPESRRGALGAVKVQVLNFHAFQQRDLLAATSGDAKKLLRAGSGAPRLESMAAVLGRARQEARISGRQPESPPEGGYGNDPARGFVYECVPRVSARVLAYDLDTDPALLVDRPHSRRGAIRVFVASDG